MPASPGESDKPVPKKSDVTRNSLLIIEQVTPLKDVHMFSGEVKFHVEK